MSEIPEWMMKTTQEARELFGLGGADWRFVLRLSDKPGGDADNLGWIDVDSVYQTATIELNADLEDNEAGRATIYHEVLHAAHQAVDHQVFGALKKTREREQYRDQVENFIQRISRSLAHRIKGT